ncbi:alpha/beta hydrolase family protein [Glaciimonas soli]|uniref:Dienelactone hydrolase n=1 Tax=Glaciimonas soli TaxID=2590999 RepID=A0A843YUL1_9BURK|nr:hypothetical protein [Glaciimonas soli]MQR01188.1 hypothetical protein [Glaciimonas soli]
MVAELTLQAGMRTMTVRDSDHHNDVAHQAMPAVLFYPTRSPTRLMTMGPFSPVVAFNGVPDLPPNGLKGLILLSHGTGGSLMAHYNLAQRLAQHGYLVAALQHSGDNWNDRSLVLSPNYFSERALQLSRLLDVVLADPQWRDHIPLERIGALGHSAGGFSVLSLAGGIADRQLAQQHCEAVNDDQLFCTLVANPDEAMTHSAPVDVMDGRIKAVFAMAPNGILFTAASMQRMIAAIQIVTAEKDSVLPAQYHASWLRAHLPQAHFEEVSNAGHFAFMAQPATTLPSDAGDAAENPPGFDRGAYLLKLEQQVVAFFDQNLS